MRKMAKFASLCLAATLSMTTVLTAIPQDARIVMAEESETDNRQGGAESFEGDAKTLHYAYDARTKKLTLTGVFKSDMVHLDNEDSGVYYNGGDVFELLDDYINFDDTSINDIYVDFSIDCELVTFRTGIGLGMEGEQIGDTRIEKVFDNISFGPNFINTMGRLKSFKEMFQAEGKNSGFKNINLSGWKTGSITNMSRMFEGEKYLKNLDVSELDTSNVKYMEDMFSGCSQLSKLDVSNFNTSNVLIMASMFAYCSGLTNIDVRNFDTQNVEDMSYMFAYSKGLENIDVSSMNTKHLKNMTSMFEGCSKLTELDLSHFDTESLEYVWRIVDRTENLKVLNMGFKFPQKVTDFELFDCYDGTESNLHVLITPFISNGEENKTVTLNCHGNINTYKMYDIETHNYVQFKPDEYYNQNPVIDIDEKSHKYVNENTHEWDNAPHSATCTEKSVTSMCTICGERIGTESEALGHIPGSTVIENRIEPTYDKEGGYDEVVYCTRDDNGCGHSELSRKHIVLEKLKKPESTDDKKEDSKKDDSVSSSKPSSTASTKTTYADGLNQINGEWVYCKNNKIDTSYTGLCKYNGSWWYVKNGKVDFSATTLCKYNGSWFYVNGGKVNFSYTGLCKYNGSWWYIKGGQVSFTTTLCKYNGTWWYVKNGQVDFKTTGLCKYNGAWWYVKGGKVSFTTTLCKYNGTWWYIKNGKVDFSSTTLCKYGNAWYCVSGGKVAWNYTGLCKYGSAWYYVQKGVVNFKTTTLTKYAGTWWYVRNGVLNTSTTLCKYGNSWFAVSGGKVAWGYSGTMKYNGGTYNIVNGKVKF